MATAILAHTAAFPADGADSFGIDRVELTLSPNLDWSYQRGWRLTPEGRAALKASKGNRFARGYAVSTSYDDHIEIQVLGGEARVAMQYKANMLRRVRPRLIAAGHYPARDHRADGARTDNYIDPVLLAPDVNLHDECIKQLRALLDEAREAYCASIAKFFGIPLATKDVRVTISKIELTWDVHTATAGAAPGLWWRAWKCAMPGAAIGLGLGDDQPLRIRRTSATKHREADAAIGANVLRADPAKGSGAKLYPKADHLLRFEVEFGKRNARKRLKGRAIRLDSLRHLAQDLSVLAQGPYATLLKAQANLVCQEVLSLTDLIGVFVQSGRSWPKLRPIIAAWEAGNLFHNVDEKHSGQLKRLKDMGYAEYVGRGLWAPTKALQFTLNRVGFLRTQTEGPV